MAQYFLGADLGGTKTHVLITDGEGRLAGFGRSGPGNHESVGYEGFGTNLSRATEQALQQAHLSSDQIVGAGFGVAGYDWPIEYQPTLDIISSLGLSCPVGLVNDTELGLYYGSPRGWGVVVVSGTGCNCRGWDASRTHLGRVTGGGIEFGEFAGASEVMFMVERAIAYEWTGRGPSTALSTAFIEKFGENDLHDLLQGLICHRYEMDAVDALIVFKIAAQGDVVANSIIRWAGRELGKMALSVIRQLHFETVEFDLVQIGSMFDGSSLITREMKRVVHAIAPRATFIRAKEPPVMGALILGMTTGGITVDSQIRKTLLSFGNKLQVKNGEGA